MRVSNRTRAGDVSPIRAALVDVVIVFVLEMISLFGIVPAYNALAHTSYPAPTLGYAVILEGFAAMFMGAVTFGVTRGLHKRHPNKVRSAGLSAVMSVLLILAVGGVLLWTNGIVAASAAAFLLVPLGYRWLGFVAPGGHSARTSR